MEHTDPGQPVTGVLPPKRRRRLILIITLVLIVALVGIGILSLMKQKKADVPSVTKTNDPALDAAIAAGKELSGGNCEGTGAEPKLSAMPMKPEDVAQVIPYGLMVGDHVTPIDHQYFAPADYNSPVNAYEVYAMADGYITSIGSRTNTNQPATEYRLTFTETCTYHYYYDLVTGLEPELKAAFDKSSNGGPYTHNPFNYPVKAGQLIGYIGGRTLDFAVWDTTKPLAGFIVPEHYKAESWKLYTADPLDYYTPELKALVLGKYMRTTPPISGKIDYDIDGRLIGNWFLEGTDYGGQIGATQHGPGGARGHLSISPEHLDPSAFVISIGDYDGSYGQFVTKTNAPWPADVNTATGLVKYELTEITYVKSDGSFWDRKSFTTDPRVQYTGRVKGVVLVQMLEDRKIKFEAFPNKTAGQVSDFTANARTYTR